MTQRALGAAAGMEHPDQTISDFMSGRAKQLDYAYLGPVAKALGVPLADLFVVHESNRRDLSGQPGTGDSASTVTPGGASDALAQDRLQEQLATLAKENAALRLALDGIADELKALAAVVKARKTQSGKPRAR